MTEESSERPAVSAAKRVEKGIESVLFNGRWLMAPFYLGLVVCLAVLLYKFVEILVEFVHHAPWSDEEGIVLGVLSLVDVTLTGNLVLIVIFSGYENFVSRIDAAGHPDWPDWMTKVDFGALKQKLLASIVAISGHCLSLNFAARHQHSPVHPGHGILPSTEAGSAHATRT